MSTYDERHRLLVESATDKRRTDAENSEDPRHKTSKNSSRRQSLEKSTISFQIRPLRPSDYPAVISVLNLWWGGRHITDLLPQLFFHHFHLTSLIIEKAREPVAFLVGFVSPARSEEAYIHFVGVHPDYRRRGLAKHLYHHFFATVSKEGCRKVRCLTSPTNSRSIQFHTRLGFQLTPSKTLQDGIPVHKNYDGPGRDRVLFEKELE